MASHIAFLSLALFSSFAASVPLSTPGSTIDTRDNVQSESRFTYPLDKREKKAFPLRVLPLGASITFGVQSSDGNGYRKALRDQLRFEGWEVNMVGNEQNGTMHDNDNSGYPGYRVDEIIAQAERAVGRQPNLITINAGTNDAAQNKTGFEVETTGKRMDKMLDLLYEKIPGVTILLSTVLPNRSGATDKRARIINPQYRDIVEKRRKQNQRIVLAEMYESDTPWIKGDISADGTHPNDAGYRKMAAIWWAAFQEADKAGMLQPPNQATTVNRCENNLATKLDANKISIPANFYDPVQAVQFNKLTKDEGREVVWAKDGEAFYVYKWINDNYADGARLDIKTKCLAKDVRWLDVNADGLDDFVCLSIGKSLNIQLNKGGDYPPQFEDVGKCTVPHGGDDGEIIDPKLPHRP